VGVFGWTVVGSVAGVVAVAAVVAFGLVPLLQGRRKSSVPAGAGLPGQVAAGPPGKLVDDLPTQADEVPVVVGDIAQEPAGFQPRADLLEELDVPSGQQVSVVHAVMGCDTGPKAKPR
jgi:hypothetical protein